MFGDRLDIKNTKTFSAEIIKRMYGIVYKEELYIYADKYLVRDYIAKCIGENYLVPLVGVYNCPREIPWDELEDGVFLKTNNGSRFNVQYNSKTNKSYYRWLLWNWLRIDYSKFAGESQYKKIKPKIIVEMNVAENAKKLEEYNCYVFNGNTEFVYYHNSEGVKTELYRNKEKVDFVFNKHCKDAEISDVDFFKVIACAEKVSELFGFVRADFFVHEHKVYFNELTFSPRAGMAAFVPDCFNFKYGEMLKRYPIINIKESSK